METKKIQQSPTQQILCLALGSAYPENTRKILSQLLSQTNIQSLNLEALQDEVGPHLHYLFTKYDITSNSQLESIFDKTKTRITTLMKALDNIAIALDKNGISIIALKNAGITRGIFQHPALSPMGDIDLLVKPKDFRIAHQIILDLGYTFKFRSIHEKEDIEEAFRHGGTEYYKDISGEKVWVELQWRPIAGRWIQEENEPKAEDLFARSIAIQDTSVRLLSNEDNLLQVCLHTAKHSYVRAPGFRLHSDVDRIVGHTKLDWECFTRRASQLQVKTACYFSLIIPRLLLNTAIPEHVLKTLSPNPIKRALIWKLILKAGIFNQTKKKFTKLSYIMFNILLYDSLWMFWKGIFPPLDHLKKQQGFSSNWLAPYMYFRRIFNLLFIRNKL